MAAAFIQLFTHCFCYKSNQCSTHDITGHQLLTPPPTRPALISHRHLLSPAAQTQNGTNLVGALTLECVQALPHWPAALSQALPSNQFETALCLWTAGIKWELPRMRLQGSCGHFFFLINRLILIALKPFVRFCAPPLPLPRHIPVIMACFAVLQRTYKEPSYACWGD